MPGKPRSRCARTMLRCKSMDGMLVSYPLMTRKRGVLVVIAVSLVVLATAGVRAQQKALKVDVDLVMVNVTVTDPDNKLIMDLKPESFQVFEDKIGQKI